MVYLPERNYGCRITRDVIIKGYRAIILENQLLRITILADKGTDIWEFLYKPLDVDFMWRSPMELRNQRNFVPTSSSEWGFWYDYYEGGWQEILPSAGLPCNYKGADQGLHGESSIMPWEFQIITDTPEIVAVRFWTRLYRTPFYIEKSLTLRSNSHILEIEETLINEAREPMDLVWGHHPVLGEAFLSEDCVIDSGAQKVHVMPDLSFETQRFSPGTTFDWPVGTGRSGESIDISRIPPANNGTADMLYLTGFESGWFAVTDQQRGLGFGMLWPVDVFPYLWFWQVCQGAFGYPWYGRTYNMALEFFTSQPGNGVADAVKNGTALTLRPGEKRSVTIQAIVFTGKGRVKELKNDGSVEWQ